MKIRNISKQQKEIKDAFVLVRTVFMRFEAPVQDDEGMQTFLDYIDGEANINALAFYAAYEGDELRGVIATRNSGSYATLFFVNQPYQGKGIGRQ